MYKADSSRYKDMQYNYCGKSGLQLPLLSLGLWQNFGTDANEDDIKDILTYAFDRGITHFDLANNYGPLPGSAEENFGKIINGELKAYRDEIIVSTKAGYVMWNGPYGNGGSKKYLVSSLDQSLDRMKLDYVDIFYHHRPDKNTPLEETAQALDLIVHQGKALYIGLSNYKLDEVREITKIFKELKTPYIIDQVRYSMLDRWIEKEDEDGLSLCDYLEEEAIGCIAFSPLAQGLLSGKYSNEIPGNSRFEKAKTMSLIFNEANLEKVRQLQVLADEKGQTMSQFALNWIRSNVMITSILIGVSSRKQLEENLEILYQDSLSEEELEKVERILK